MGQPALDRQLIFLKNSYDFNFGMSLMPIYIYIYAKPNALSGPAFPSKAWIGVLDPRYPQKWEMNVLMIENLNIYIYMCVCVCIICVYIHNTPISPKTRAFHPVLFVQPTCCHCTARAAWSLVPGL